MLRASNAPESMVPSRGSIQQVYVRPSSAASHGHLTSPTSQNSSSAAFLGIARQWYGQLALLAINLMCCGGIVGLSRLLPQVAEEQFHQHSYTSALLFIVTFGLFKAVFNLLVGTLANAYGRRYLLLIGWSVSYLTPVLIWLALHWSLSWNWIILSTALFGASQGLCTSCVVVMVMDVVPQRARGISMGVLECTIYCSLGIFALIASAVKGRFPDFQPVLVIHFTLCTIGLIAALRARETQSIIAHKDLALSDDLENETEGDDDGSSVSLRRPNFRREFDSSGEESTSELEPPPRSHALQWESLREQEPVSLVGITVEDSSTSSAVAVGSSILPNMTLHTIPASPGVTPFGNSSMIAAGFPSGASSSAHPDGTPFKLNRSQSGSALSSAVSATQPQWTPRKSSASPAPRKHSLTGGGVTPPVLLAKSGSREDIFTGSSVATPSPISPVSSITSSASGIGGGGGNEAFLTTFRSSLNRICSSSVLRAIIQAGFFNNFRDGVLWGILPAFFALSQHKVSQDQLGILLTIYPMVWGLGQLITGRLSDQYGRGKFIIGGLALQGLSILGLVLTRTFVQAGATTLVLSHGYTITAQLLGTARFVVWCILLFLIGLGTACSYPVLQAYIGDYVSPVHRASTIGVYRLCRDLGYAIGGLLSGFIADAYGVERCLVLMSVLLLFSALWSWIVLPHEETEAWNAGHKKEAQ